MARNHCTGAGLLDAIRSAVANLEAFADEVNALNVFPVPDGDTGTNMVATARAALEEAERVGRDVSVERVAAAVSHGALMGARGNSGVITSQILRGLADGLAGKRRFTGLDLANGLTLGAQTAYSAVAKPVEGTILTVIREAAAAAVETAERDDAMAAVLGATVEGARTAVARTPSLLPILRDAGVVDSGGQGLLRLFEGALLSVQGRPVHLAAGVASASRTGTVEATGQRSLAPAGTRIAAPLALSGDGAEAEADGFGYETVFLLSAPAGSDLDLAAVQNHLNAIGTSVLVAGDARLVKVHVHNDRPDEVISYGLSLGTLTRITVENLDMMADDVREARAAAFIGERRPSPDAIRAAATTRAVAAPTKAGLEADVRDIRSHPVAPRRGSEAPTTSTNGTGRRPGVTGEPVDMADAPVTVDPTLGPAVVAVVAGDGLEKVFRDIGVDQVVRGGQSANPSTGELLRIARLARSREVILLPNNPNVRLAAEQAARICEDRRLLVVPTRNAAEGVAALLAFDRERDAPSNVEPMTKAARDLATLQVTEAVRDAKFGGKKVKKGQTIVLDPDDGLVAVDSDPDKAVLAAISGFPAGSELVTLYYGDQATLLEAAAIAHRIGQRITADVEVVHGGQPHYRYLISAE